jgi:hypothetical protein
MEKGLTKNKDNSIIDKFLSKYINSLSEKISTNKKR